MDLLKLIFTACINILFTSADPYLFGSRKRRKEKDKLSKEFKEMAADTQSEIDAAKVKNPFESAAAKSAMTKAARNSRQLATRYANMMGGNANPEAIIAAQGATQQSVADTAGNIAVGAEANKNAELARLRAEKASQLGQSAAMKQSSIDEIGSGWKAFFDDALPALGGLTEAGGNILSSGGGGGGGEGAAIAAALSDVRAKENIHYIGELQGQSIYKYNYIGCNQTHIGVLAQEVESINPEVIDTSGELLKVYYDKLFNAVNK